VFNSEPGRPGGGVVSGRKGGKFMRLDVVGKAAHAGNNLADGISAIEEIARKIVKLHALTDLAVGISCNVGTIAGGQTVNTVAPDATAEVDLRYIHPDDGARAFRAVEAIVAESNVPGTTATLEITGEFEPLVASDASKRLFDHYVACARVLGQTVEGMFAGGCADSGFAASVGAPTICAVGPIGGRAHSPEEYLEVDSIVPRAQALVLAIMRLDRV
jgi:glutamate carboxypeptidase